LQQTRFAEKIGCDPALRTDIDATAVRLVRCSIDRGALPFPSNHFTAVTMLAVIEHLRPESLSSVLTESYRVLEPGGRLVLTSPAPWTRGVLLAFAALRLVSRAEICDHKAYYGRRQLAELLARAGFASASVTCGSFQLAANNWASATK
jgi:SAM-dependent methyltransferase